MKKIINSKYRALYLMIFFLIFNLGYSLYFGRNTDVGFYSSPSCIIEYILDIITSIGIFFSMMLAGFDMIEKLIERLNDTMKKLYSFSKLNILKN
ncbi:hypothetical protein LIBA6276_00064 [Clostridioides phage LIBA6276]|uniref:hypothetical protein n=1 Tax=Clostridioides difficile TaxID=1496 RepID=UPI000694E9C0|nr:hypothetical protein [Clostridioides difficile]AUO78282.1 hypothetical protein LIBA6276_00064 [Clostridioides phage LIBA6276]